MIQIEEPTIEKAPTREHQVFASLADVPAEIVDALAISYTLETSNQTRAGYAERVHTPSGRVVFRHVLAFRQSDDALKLEYEPCVQAMGCEVICAGVTPSQVREEIAKEFEHFARERLAPRSSPLGEILGALITVPKPKPEPSPTIN